MDSLVGRTLGPYELQDGLGGGGMGMVYRAMHQALQQPRAIKILRPDLAADPDVVERFRREAMIAAGLRHPNIVLVYDVAEHENVHYMVMDLVEGESLRDLIRSAAPLPLDRVVNLLGQLAAALDYAHARGVVHRDVKPGNVMVAPDDHVTLVDFGIARAVEASRLTRSGMVIGTAEYMAPETFTGEGSGLSADQYALGIVAYEVLTAQLPFKGNPTAVGYAQVHVPLPSVHKLRPDLPPSVDEALQRQTAKQPDQRFPTAQSFVEALAGDATTESPTLVVPPLSTSPTIPLRPTVRPSPGPAPAPSVARGAPEPYTGFAEPRQHGPSVTPMPPVTPPPPAGSRSAAGRLTGYVLAVLALVIAGTLALCQNEGGLPLISQGAPTPTTVAKAAATSVPTAPVAAPAATTAPSAPASAGAAVAAGAAAPTSPGAAPASAASAGATTSPVAAAALTSAPATAPSAVAPTAASAPATPVAAAPPPTAVSPPASAPAPAQPPDFQTVLDEHFVDNQRGWPNDREGTAWLADGVYHLFARDPNRFIAVGAPGLDRFRDVEVSLRGRKVGGPPGGGFGLIVRDQDTGQHDGHNQGGRYVELEIGEGRQWGIWRRDQDHWVDLQVFVPTDVVRPPGELNDLVARAIGSHLIFIINGTQVADIDDPTLPDGGVGIYVAGDGNMVDVEQFTVRAPR